VLGTTERKAYTLFDLSGGCSRGSVCGGRGGCKFYQHIMQTHVRAKEKHIRISYLSGGRTPSIAPFLMGGAGGGGLKVISTRTRTHVQTGE
jgi:hypothetical protein